MASGKKTPTLFETEYSDYSEYPDYSDNPEYGDYDELLGEFEKKASFSNKLIVNWQWWIIFDYFFLLLLECKFDCNKDGTSGGICNKYDGLCVCKVGWYGNACDQGKMDSY